MSIHRLHTKMTKVMKYAFDDKTAVGVIDGLDDVGLFVVVRDGLYFCYIIHDN